YVSCTRRIENDLGMLEILSKTRRDHLLGEIGHARVPRDLTAKRLSLSCPSGHHIQSQGVRSRVVLRGCVRLVGLAVEVRCLGVVGCSTSGAEALSQTKSGIGVARICLHGVAHQ